MFRVLWALLRGLCSGWLDRALYIAALEQQLAFYQSAHTKPRISVWDRCFWIFLFRRFSRWKNALVFVQPNTVIDWHRKGYRALWRWKSRRGRPPIDKKVIALIESLSRDNPSWGAARIRLELKKLGHSVAIETVRKYSLGRSLPPGSHSSKRHSQSWRTFLKNEARGILACDFVTQHLAGFQTAYVFSVIHIESRKVLWTNVSKSPSLDWVKNQLREVLAFDHPYKFLIHDNDGIFGQFGAHKRKLFGVRCNLDRWLRAIGMRGIPTPYHAPNANAFMERFNRSLREEALNHLIFLSEEHLRRVVREYVDYYNHARPSQALGKVPDLKTEPPPGKKPVKVTDNVVAFPVLGGLHHDYQRVA